jgi:hypothetical protein
MPAEQVTMSAIEVPRQRLLGVLQSVPAETALERVPLFQACSR